GDVAGYYGYYDGRNSYGFLFSGGTYTTIGYPRAQYTYLLGMNNMGQIVGYATERGSDLQIGFVYNVSTQTFTDVNILGSTNEGPYGINDAGTIVGFFPSSSA